MTNEIFIEKLKNLNPKGKIAVQAPDGSRNYEVADIVKDDKLDALIIHLAPYNKNYLDNVDLAAGTTNPHHHDVINQNAPSDHFNQNAADKGISEQQNVLNDETPKMRTVPADDPASERSRVANTKNLSQEEESKLRDLFKNDRPDKSGNHPRDDKDQYVGSIPGEADNTNRNDREDVVKGNAKHPNPAMETSLPTVAPGKAPQGSKDKHEHGKKV